MKMTRILPPILAPLVLTVSALASAGGSGYSPAPQPPPAVYEAGTAVVRIGASYVNFDNDSGKWRYNRNLYPYFDGLGYKLDTDTTWNFTVGFMPMDHFMVEVGYVGKSNHDLDLRRLQGFFGANKVKAGTLERRSGSVMFDWFPVCKESWVQPYIGVGANYTDFNNEGYRTAANDYLAEVADAVGPATLYIDDVWGWTGQVGVDILFGRDSNWLVNAAVQYQDVEAKTDLHYAVPADVGPGVFINAARADLDVNPWVYNLGIGYKF